MTEAQDTRAQGAQRGRLVRASDAEGRAEERRAARAAERARVVRQQVETDAPARWLRSILNAPAPVATPGQQSKAQRPERRDTRAKRRKAAKKERSA